MLGRADGPSPVLGSCFADDLRGDAEHQRACGRGELLRQHRAGAHDGFLADHVSSHEHRGLSDEDVARDHARVHECVVADGHVRPNERGLAFVGVDRGVVLHVRTLADDDAVHVAAQHGAEPYGCPAFHRNVADQHGGRRDESVRRDLRHLPPVAVKRHVRNNSAMKTRDLRVTGYRPLVPPAIILEELALSEMGSRLVATWRDELTRILSQQDDRLIAIVGPCSIHDPAAALDYARRLHDLGQELRADVVMVMRAYFMKPRTSVGWKGLVSDPHRDGSFRINDGLRLTRRLLLDLVEIGLPAACEFVDPISPQYTSDLVAWAAIGARTTESQVHRELASGLSMPVGFKNGTDGSVQVAIDAVRAAREPHSFMGVTEQGLAAIVETGGNPSAHVVLRGGTPGPNYDAASVRRTLESLAASSLPAHLVIDLSHGNSLRDHARQPVVAREVASQIAAGERGIVGVMAESVVGEGCQDADAAPRVYGHSVTGACLGRESTVAVLTELAGAIRTRRDSSSGARSADIRTRAPSR